STTHLTCCVNTVGTGEAFRNGYRSEQLLPQFRLNRLWSQVRRSVQRDELGNRPPAETAVLVVEDS
ncbi:MAG: hypothetical protein NTX07_06770, partial [Solirubrobacterales bacterium]|nr:hypothetical protein [Solirubrobacterales bacterium]